MVGYSISLDTALQYPNDGYFRLESSPIVVLRDTEKLASPQAEYILLSKNMSLPLLLLLLMLL